jgi:hypothetical protein
MLDTRPQTRLPVMFSVALLMVALGSPVRAETIAFRNDSPLAVVIHVSSVFQGAVLRARPCQLLPHNTSPGITLPGNKVLTITDARFPTRVLYQGPIPASERDLLFSIQPGFPPPRLKVTQVPAPPGS